MLETVFLDAGGVLVYPNWTRISRALADRGVQVDPAALAAAEPFAKKQIDDRTTISSTTDAGRGWLYFNLIFERAGVPLTPEVEHALAELHAYHQTSNLWELVPPSIVPSLAALRKRGLKLTVVSNANGRLKVLFDRLELSSCVDCVLDSHDEGVEKPDPRYFEIAPSEVARAARRRFTSAISITWTSSVRATRDCAACCWTKPVCIPMRTAPGSARFLRLSS